MCIYIYVFGCTIKRNGTTITSSLHIQDNQGDIKKSISSLCVSNIMELLDLLLTFLQESIAYKYVEFS